jgi:aspartate/tyrosine/aromatic aminotransferase
MCRPNPTWANHAAIFKKAGLTTAQYRYFKPETKGLDFDGMLEDLGAGIKPGDIVLLHSCAHNPTGVDPTMEQWEAIANLVKSKEAIPLFDCAYQGYATGDLSTDAASVRLFESLGIEMMICQSYSKNFGLYGERIGALSITTNGGPEVTQAIQSQLKKIVRPMYSNPPSNGARIVAHVLSVRKPLLSPPLRIHVQFLTPLTTSCRGGRHARAYRTPHCTRSGLHS